MDDARQPVSSGRGRILWVAAEISPHASTGGLGEVVATLPPRLATEGWDVDLLVPYYRPLARALRDRALRPEWEDEIELAGRRHRVRLLADRPANGVTLTLLDCPDLYEREGIYGDPSGPYPDNALRFGVLCSAAALIAARTSPGYDVVHVHDWHAALVPALLDDIIGGVPDGADPRGQAGIRSAAPPTVLTIHNLGYQGTFDAATLRWLGVPDAALPVETRTPRDVSFLEVGIRWADAVTTVSPGYAREVQRAGGGHGLGDALVERGRDFSGILNGLDPSDWDPATDPRLSATYDVTTLARKAVNKSALQKELGLPVDAQVPLVGYFGRFSPQKGIDVFLDAAPRLLRKNVQVALGGSGDRETERSVLDLCERFPHRMAARLGYDVAFSHRFLAGIDILVMPSRYEPCGLTQLQALHYGTIPVVHAVGGLTDTVRPLGARTRSHTASNGFLFHTLGSRGLSLAVGKALRYYDQPELWRSLQANAMRTDVSWRQGVDAYGRLYETLMRRGRRRSVTPAASTRSLRAGAGAIAASAPEDPPDPVEAAQGPTPVAVEDPPPRDPRPGYVDLGPELPATYGEEIVHVLVQSPRLLYAYWELLSTEADGGARLEVESGGIRTELASHVPKVGEYWIHVEPGRDYRIHLRTAEADREIESNLVRTPVDVSPGPGVLRWRRLGPPRRPRLVRAPSARLTEAPGPLPRSLGQPSGASRR